MVKIFCYLDTQENYIGQVKEYIESLDALGHEVFLYTGVCSSENQPHDILYSIDSQLDKGYLKEQLIFLTNITDLFHIVYRLYHQIFTDFIYLEQDMKEKYVLSNIYLHILNFTYDSRENLSKKIYTNINGSRIGNQNFVYEAEDCFKLIEDLSNNREQYRADVHQPDTAIKKYYLIDSVYYIFEPIISKKRVVISFNKDKGQSEFIYPEYTNMQYEYFYDNEKIKLLFSKVKDLSNNIIEILDILKDLETEMQSYYPFVYNTTIGIIDDFMQLNPNKKNILEFLILSSFLMQITKNPFYFNQFILEALESKYLSGNNRYFIWNQCKRYSLENKVSSDENTSRYMKELYMKACAEYEQQIPIALIPIPKEEREHNTIVVFTTQFLGEGHAPTRTALERCYTLLKGLGKKVLLINTKEQLSMEGGIVLYNFTKGNEIQEYNDLKYYEYKGAKIPYYQPKGKMPSIPVLVELIEYIKRIKPMMIISIGNGSVTADICGKLVPHASIGLAFSQVVTSKALFSVIGRKVRDDEWNKFEKEGYSREHIIESTFTFDLKEKKGCLSRELYQIPEDKFVLVTVGIRLDFEVDDLFIQTISRTFCWGTHIIFAGVFDTYQSYCEKYPEFKENSTFVGYCNDIMALMELCDLYVNPRRLGGGFSIIEAFHEGKPGVTLSTGDIAVAAGEEFCVGNYDEMIQNIKRYIEDKAYYNLMVSKAKKREKVVTDSSYAMEEILAKIYNSELFF